MLLNIEDLDVSVEGKQILKKINITINSGEVVILFGPNGCGKSTLLKTIMGFGGYDITGGKITFKDTVFNGLSIDKRVKQGIGLVYQHPPQIVGVKLHEVASFLTDDKEKSKSMSERLNLTEHINRDINLGFSGGERKRSEIFQAVLQDPDLLLLDEPESGVDLENISLIGEVLNEFLKKPGKSALIITHTGYILDYVNAKRGCVMMDGDLTCVGEPKEMFESIRESGYEKCKECKWILD